MSADGAGGYDNKAAAYIKQRAAINVIGRHIGSTGRHVDFKKQTAPRPSVIYSFFISRYLCLPSS